MKIRRSFLLEFWLSTLIGGAQLHAQGLSEEAGRESIRRELSDMHSVHLSTGPDRQPSLQERVVELGRQSGMDRPRLQSLLLEFAEEGLLALTSQSAPSASPESKPKEDAEINARVARKVAAGALSVLGSIADRSVMDRLLNLAEAAPPALEPSTTRALVYTVSREAPEALPAIARQVTAGQASTMLFSMLQEVLKYRLPAEEKDRALLTAKIVEVFQEGFRNPNRENRIYLDKVLEEYAPAFRNSEERRRILAELSVSINPIVKRYAEEKLSGLTVANHQNPPRVADEPLRPQKDGTVPFTKAVAEGEVMPFLSPFFLLGSLLGMGALAWVVWRVTTRH